MKNKNLVFFIGAFLFLSHCAFKKPSKRLKHSLKPSSTNNHSLKVVARLEESEKKRLCDLVFLEESNKLCYQVDMHINLLDFSFTNNPDLKQKLEIKAKLYELLTNSLQTNFMSKLKLSALETIKEDSTNFVIVKFQSNVAATLTNFTQNIKTNVSSDAEIKDKLKLTKDNIFTLVLLRNKKDIQSERLEKYKKNMEKITASEKEFYLSFTIK